MKLLEVHNSAHKMDFTELLQSNSSLHNFSDSITVAKILFHKVVPLCMLCVATNINDIHRITCQLRWVWLNRECG